MEVNKVLRTDQYFIGTALYVRYMCEEGIIWMTKSNIVPPQKTKELEDAITSKKHT